jgi:hypothetical protein
MNYGHKDASMNHHVQLDGILICWHVSTGALVSVLQSSAAPNFIAGCNLLLQGLELLCGPCNVLSILAQQASTWHNGLWQSRLCIWFCSGRQEDIGLNADQRLLAHSCDRQQLEKTH